MGSLLVALFAAGLIVATAAGLALLGPLGLIIAAIAAIGAVIIFFYTLWKTQWENIKEIFFAVWNGIKDFFTAIWNGIVDLFNAGIERIKSAIASIQSAYNSVVSAVSAPIKGAVSAVKSVVSSKLGQVGGLTINLNGDFYTTTEVAEEFGNELARIIKNQINLGGIRA